MVRAVVFRSAGFTLLEVVLAIGLCSAVMALLTTAIDLYLVRVDTSRTQVETAQLARALLNEIANDLRAVRLSMTSADGGSPGGTGLGQATSGSGSGSTSRTRGTSTDLGIYGTLTELRIDRAARRSWRQVAVPDSQLLADADPQEMPQTVEYFFVEGRAMPSAEFAAGGVTVGTSLEGYTGLYRRQTPTAAMLAGSMVTTPGARAEGQQLAELLAPEVVQASFMYYDGSQWYEEWDSLAQQGLPVAVEVRLSLFSDVIGERPAERVLDEESRRRDPARWVEYRLLVRIPQLEEPQQLKASATPNVGETSTGGTPNAN